MAGPTVSVLIPVFNCERFVGAAIQSIIDQTYSDWELLICDDASTDSTYEVCRSYADRDPRISVLRNESNRHISKTTNRLIAAARGKFLTIQDADDISAAGRLEAQLRVMAAMPQIGVVSGIGAWLDDNGKIFHHHPALLVKHGQFPSDRHEMVRSLLIRGSKVMNCGVMFRREALEGIEGPLDPDALSSQDWQLFCDIAHNWQFYGLDEIVEYVRRGDQHLSQIKQREMILSEAKRCIRCVYEKYRDVESSPVNRPVYCRAMGKQLLVEARFWGRWRGAKVLWQSLLYDPGNWESWATVAQMGYRASSRAVASITAFLVHWADRT